MIYIGIDNGVTGSIGAIYSEKSRLYHAPVRRVLNYTKKRAFLNRIDGVRLKTMLFKIFDDAGTSGSFCFIERPMINPGRWNASVSAIRCLEATLIVLEELAVPYQFIDSKEWQKVLLPSGLEKQELKIASLDVAVRLFPKLDLSDFKDGDGILIAEYCRKIRCSQ